MRERPPANDQQIVGKYFNPRSLAGATAQRYHAFTKSFSISIHAPLRERRKLVATSPDFVKISIHAPLRERRASALASSYNVGISIHAPLRERRASALSANYNLGISIHAPLRERLHSSDAYVWYS